MSKGVWLFFIPQIPATPSSLRVLVWRHLKEAGAVSLGGGVWALPRSETSEAMVREVLSEVKNGGGSGLLLIGDPLEPTTGDDLVARFRADRDEEYGEFLERCGGFLAEIQKETAAGKFTFAELEENEEDLKKMENWLRKIRNRDFHTATRSGEADASLQRCHEALEGFARKVYAREGAGPSSSPGDEGADA